ncbi:unnamed protein product [Penicillium salamii]|uniref:Uncharacterized protein n=1 Tax=Penicillium salamii TaxID=1612424 RepID=A0A9W4K036_9EURO|nr:unnamed protein product [Penicillium salamii]
MSDLQVSQADLFLLSEWQQNSSLSVDAQREQIFAKWVALGLHGREPYIDQQRKTTGRYVLGLPLHSQELLNRIRLPTERSLTDDPLWLRTCYEPSTEESWARIQSYLEHKFGGNPPPIFNSPSLYNFGSDWEKVFLRCPELLSNTQSAEEYDEYVNEALQEGIEDESEDAQHAEESGYDPVEDGLPWICFYSEYLWRLVAGRIHIVDAITLASDGRDAGKVLVMWFDQCGRAIRYSREELDEAGSIAGCFDYILRDRRCWQNAEIGGSYEWGAPLGPPYGENKRE